MLSLQKATNSVHAVSSQNYTSWYTFSLFYFFRTVYNLWAHLHKQHSNQGLPNVN